MEMAKGDGFTTFTEDRQQSAADFIETWYTLDERWMIPN